MAATKKRGAAPASPGAEETRGKPQSPIERITVALRYLADELKRGPAVDAILGGAAEHREPE